MNQGSTDEAVVVIKRCAVDVMATLRRIKHSESDRMSMRRVEHETDD